MTLSIAYLGPPGTYAESAAIACANWLTQKLNQPSVLCPYPSIAQTLRATAMGETHLTVVPVENSIEGSVSITLDTLWQLDSLRIQQALVLPISHALISCAEEIERIQTVYSHPQALAQCQGWLEKFLPSVQLIPANSTTEALQHLNEDSTIAAISSQRAAQLYNLPVLAHPINDHPDNCTRFWVMSLEASPGGNHTSLAFSVPANVPGALAKPLHVFADRNINLSRIESRPSKRSLGDYLFFVDIEADSNLPAVQSALVELEHYTETLKIFGSYAILSVEAAREAGAETT
jgi:prephenate dehydratase